MVHYGFGHHIGAIPTSDKVMALCLYWVSQILYKVSLQLTKISLILLYMRIFGTVGWFKKLCISLICIIAVYGVVSCMMGVFQCDPVAYAWNRGITGGKCINLTQFFVANGSFALATDIIVLILPLPLLYGLNLPLGQKLALIPIFGLGTFVVIISAVRLSALLTSLSSDTTYDLMGTMWTIIEMNLAIVCASLPTVRVLLIRIFPRTFGSSSRTQKRTMIGTIGSKHGGNEWSKLRGNTHQVVSVKSSHDTSSEEFILQNNPSSSIQKTTQVKVEYHMT